MMQVTRFGGFLRKIKNVQKVSRFGGFPLNVSRKNRQSDRDAKRLTKKSAKPSNFNFLTNQRQATIILTNGITWQEIHFEFWTNQVILRFLLASLPLNIFYGPSRSTHVELNKTRFTTVVKITNISL